MRSKAEVIRAHLAGLRVLDIGGTGYKQTNAYEIELSEAWSLCKERVVVDASPDADISIDLNALPLPPLTGIYDIATAFDVLEHLEEEEEAITNIRKILNNKGLLILTVPAHMWLWNQFDEIARHKRRYSLSDLKKLLSNNCFNVLEAKNFFVSIIPLLLVRKILHNMLNYEPDEKILDSNLKINPLINSILGFIEFLEFKILKYLPCKIGGSIIIIAQKEG